MAPASGPTIAFVPAPDVIVRDLGGEAVLLDLSTGTYFGLNATGTRMWQLIVETPPATTDAPGVMAAEFDVSRDVVERDFREFLDRLVTKGLLRAIERRQVDSRNAG